MPAQTVVASMRAAMRRTVDPRCRVRVDIARGYDFSRDIARKPGNNRRCPRCWKGSMDANKRTRILSTVGILVIIAALVVFGLRTLGPLRSRVGSWFDTGSERRWSAGDERRSWQGGDGERVELDALAELSGFTRVSATGGWRVIVSPGDFDVAITVSERIADDVRVFTRGEVLHLTVEPGFRGVGSSMEARIVMPSLERLEIEGSAEVELTSLRLDSLDIDVDGAASVKGIDSSVGELEVDADGATNIDFSTGRVENARVEMDGASNLRIRMAGGELTGVLRGVGNVTWSGSLSREAIRIEGLGTVREQRE
ncbi:MAG: GIN domain-containing protein [Spirochaetota bacterium]